MKQGKPGLIRLLFSLVPLLLALVTAGNVTAQPLLNINFGAYPSDLKVGPAAIGITTNDYWNRYEAPFASAAVVTNLILADGSASTIGLTVLDGPGHWNNTVPDPMYQTYVYNQGGNITVTITNLPSTNYDVYIYGHGPSDDGNGVYNLSANGTKSTLNGPGWDSLVWEENVQYVLYQSIPITTADGAFTITVTPGASGYSIIGGMQIIPSGVTTPPPATNPPTIVQQPADRFVALGSNATFAVIATGTPTLTYQWTFEGSNIAGATANSYTVANVQPANVGTYAVTVSNSYGSVTSSNAILNIASLPVITSHPQSRAATAGTNVSFSVTATGATSYQWQRNFVNLSGQTNSTLFLSNVQPSAAGTYRVIVINASGSVASSNATLTVSSGIVITTQPQSQTVAVGDTASFSVTATGPQIKYQWQRNSINIAGATNSVLNLANVQPSAAGNYRVIVSNAGGSLTSSNATLTVSSGILITTQPQSQIVPQGGSASFSVTATGSALRYQWQKNLINIGGATNSVLNLANVQPNAAGTYRVIVSNTAGSVTSSNATLTVASPPDITAQPQSQSVGEGSSATFSVTATGTPLNYQWLFNGTPITGSTLATLTINPVIAAHGGNYSVIVSNSLGSVTSSNATLAVFPVDTTTAGLLNINFAAYETDVKTGLAATGITTNDYWNSYLAPFANAAALTTLKLSDGTISSAGLTVLNGYGHWRTTVPDPMYQTYVYNQGGAITTTVTNIAVGTYHVYIYGHAPSNDGNGVYTLSVSGTDYGTQATLNGTVWDNTNWQEGIQYVVFRNVVITNLNQTLTVLTTPGASGYSIIGGMQIIPASLVPDAAPSIISQPQDKTVVESVDVTFSVGANGSSPLHYQWQFNEVDIPGATTSSLTLHSVTTNQAGNYSVIVSNSVGSISSSNALLAVNTITPPSGQLIDINFGAYETDLKVGFAATGLTTNDYWNPYLAPFANAAAVPDLKFTDGTTSGAGLTVLNGYGHWRSSVPDPMYQTYDYNQGGNITVTVTNLAPATYDILIYGHGPVDNAQGVYNLKVGSVDYGTKSTLIGPGWESLAWQEGIQYVVFRNVTINNAADVLTTIVSPGGTGYSLINGIQIVPVGSIASTAPVVVTQPQSQTVLAGADVAFGVTATGSAPLSYQWQFNGMNITDATNASLSLHAVTTGNAGDYSVVIANSLGSVTSSNATLTVNTVASGLVNINFGAYETDVKAGFAAVGLTTNDYWNSYLAPFANAANIPNLLLSDGTVSGIGLTVLSGYGHWRSTHPDPMHKTYAYTQGGNITVTLTNLLVGGYDLYIYGHGPSDDGNGVYSVAVDDQTYGTNSTVNGSAWSQTSWQEGVQYVVFHNVFVTNSSQTLTLTTYPGVSGYSLISGLQVVPLNSAPPAETNANLSSIRSLNRTRLISVETGLTLNMQKSGGNLVFSWPAIGTNAIVQEASSLAPTTWVDLSTNSIVHGDNNHSLTVPLPTVLKFYRLKNP